MKKLIFVLLGLVSFAIVMSHGSGEEGRTGSPSETTCRTAGCHTTFVLNSGPGSISITHNIPVAGYTPSQSYTINVTLTQNNVNLFGFGFEALNSSNTNAGSFIITNSTSTQLATALNGRVNVIHKNNGGLTPAGIFTKTFSFTWVAPSTNVGNVTFYSAGNAANDNNNASGDYIYSTSMVIPCNNISITTGTIVSNPLCEGITGISIPYTIAGTMNAGNVFTAELSDATGSFTSPIILGTLNSTLSGTINSTTPIPPLAGTSYRIRVKSSDPAVIGSNNGTNLTIQLNPTTANAGNNQTVCSNSVSMSANTPANGNGTWTLIAGGGNITNINSPNTSITNLSAGINTFRWSITNSCGTSFDEVNIDFTGTITVADAGTDQEICISSPNTILSANIAVTGTGIWSLVSGTGTITDGNLPNSTVTGLGIGNNIFRWTISNPPCSPTMDEVTITVKNLPSVANAGIDFVSCSSNAVMNANNPSVGMGTWTVINGTGNFSNVNDPNAAVTGLSAGINTFEWTIANSPCAESSDQIVIDQSGTIVTSDAGSDQQICGTSTSLNGNSPGSGSGLWTVFSGSGTFTDATSETSSVSNLTAGNNIFLWTISNNPCQPSIDTINVNAVIPSIANAGEDILMCDTLVFLDGNIPSSGNASWTMINGTGNIIDPNLATTLVDDLSIGSNEFVWTITNVPCPVSIDTVLIENCNVPYIHTDSISGSPFCASTSYDMNVSFSKWGTFAGPYIVELSDANGSFASPQIIGYGNNSPISLTLPSGLPSGNGYLVRIRDFDSGYIGPEAPNEISINNCILGIYASENISGLLVYPNPNNGNFHLQFPNGLLGNNFEILILDITGKSIWAGNSNYIDSNQITEMNLSEIESGLYILKIFNENMNESVPMIIEN